MHAHLMANGITNHRAAGIQGLGEHIPLQVVWAGIVGSVSKVASNIGLGRRLLYRLGGIGNGRFTCGAGIQCKAAYLQLRVIVGGTCSFTVLNFPVTILLMPKDT